MCNGGYWLLEHNQPPSTTGTDPAKNGTRVASGSRPHSPLVYVLIIRRLQLGLLAVSFEYLRGLRIYPVKFAGKIIRVRKQLLEEKDPLPEASYLKALPQPCVNPAVNLCNLTKGPLHMKAHVSFLCWQAPFWTPDIINFIQQLNEEEGEDAGRKVLPFKEAELWAPYEYLRASKHLELPGPVKEALPRQIL